MRGRVAFARSGTTFGACLLEGSIEILRRWLAGGESVNGFGVLGGNRLDLGQGQLDGDGQSTGSGVEGQGFFAMQTRNGLTLYEGWSVYTLCDGVSADESGRAGDGCEPEADHDSDWDGSDRGDGSVSVATAGWKRVVGQVGVFNFADTSMLTADGTNRFSADGG